MGVSMTKEFKIVGIFTGIFLLAVCSCSVLPMFTGIYRVGAGLGPAATFLYSGPALNILAIFLTARVAPGVTAWLQM